jgi:hypothetical protein
MKTLKLIVVVLITTFFVSVSRTDAQTYTVAMHSSFAKIYAPCGLGPINGEWTYHLTYHVDKKTGFMDHLHWNIWHADVWDSETGEKYIIVDNGNDDMGAVWYAWNHINDYIDNQYDFLPNMPLPAEMPDEGSFVRMSLKFIFNGEVYRVVTFVQLHRNASGEITADVSRSWMECNE